MLSARDMFHFFFSFVLYAFSLFFCSAFWVFNMVANFAYYRYEQVAPVVIEQVGAYEQRFATEVAAEDKAALALWSADPAAAVELLTAAGEKRGNGLVSDWLKLYQQLFMDFRDGQTPIAVKGGYAQDWYDRVAKETGDRYLMPKMESESAELNARKLKVISKQRFYGEVL